MTGTGGDLEPENRNKEKVTVQCTVIFFSSKNADYVKILRVVFNELKKTVNFSKITVVFLDFK